MRNQAASASIRGREDLDTGSCLRLLASQEIGHLGLTAKALPVVTPIRYRLFGETIVFATGCTSELHSARKHAVACVEIAGVDPSTGTEWTALATGRLRVAENPSTWPDAQPLPPAWGAPDATHFIALDIELLNGCATRTQ